MEKNWYKLFLKKKKLKKKINVERAPQHILAAIMDQPKTEDLIM